MKVVGFSQMRHKQSQQRRGRADGTIRSGVNRSANSEKYIGMADLVHDAVLGSVRRLSQKKRVEPLALTQICNTEDPWQQYLTANSDRLSHFGRRMSLFLQTLVLRGILFREQEHRQEHMNLGGWRRRAARRC
jgi:hypothetical protein